jgi:hypothetical protein
LQQVPNGEVHGDTFLKELDGVIDASRDQTREQTQQEQVQERPFHLWHIDTATPIIGTSTMMSESDTLLHTHTPNR